MDKFFQMKVFVAVAEQSGFNAAARKLEISPPAATRAVAALEKSLGIKLLNRTTRYVRTTDAGFQYLKDAKRILNDLELADDSITGINSEPQGHLVVTAPVLFGRDFILSSIVEYMQKYPKVDVEALFLDRIVNLVEEGIDVGVRIGELPDSTMRAKKIGTVRMVLCASPKYLQQSGIPNSPDDLHRHQLITSRAGSGIFDWQFPEYHQTKTNKLKSRLTISTNDAAIEAAKQDFGIVRVLSYQVGKELQCNQLKTIMENYEPTPKPINIVHREGPNANPKVRTFVDLVARNLQQNSVLN